jgi:hypothetical protein
MLFLILYLLVYNTFLILDGNIKKSSAGIPRYSVLHLALFLSTTVAYHYGSTV